MKILAGHIGVDAGLCWVGDPCYILHKEEGEDLSPTLGESWHDFCDILRKKEEAPGGTSTHASFNYDLGHEGLGVVVSTGYGDGSYPVFIETNKEGRVKSVTVEFIGEDE